ncbi:hypothetical protein GT755_12375 [Herbidospora sp. NEAU-GS84]|uniref:DUF2199 domain-containing protein n=1 Tax=Herbidospora solisilvae TaxID=2696284 RepID=A0A7C9NGJ6_9ACTN|nr:hypothetical protein [Herbidospora solisilvae]NAS22478.1 hypothetical protein [Herbidospora solisilvae]
MAPRIPKRMSGCPVHGGLAVPVVAARHRHGGRPPMFGLNHPGRVTGALLGKRCGGCGGALSTRPGGKYALLMRPVDFTRGYSAEPALHPSDCAPYALAACPMLNGHLARHRATPRDLEAERCGDPECDCHLWTTSADHHARAAAPASPFCLATYRQEDYRLHYGDADVLFGVATAGIAPLTVKLVTRGDPSVVDLTRALLAGLPLWES